ncbi:hypothetical protein BJ508DRAFT_309231 [Ascobolus immersus RN42]|uniref:Uncharacterized protein n=1 Tax=Ascobolus immersus RN42 TaxID=1160509 RepID=A0A3N4HX67_ASCIM|nr:hypothetical protein BJ508DRAFT_309231 [Ascobolus immersus RN42]
MTYTFEIPFDPIEFFRSAAPFRSTPHFTGPDLTSLRAAAEEHPNSELPNFFYAEVLSVELGITPVLSPIVQPLAYIPHIVTMQYDTGAVFTTEVGAIPDPWSYQPPTPGDAHVTPIPGLCRFTGSRSEYMTSRPGEDWDDCPRCPRQTPMLYFCRECSYTCCPICWSYGPRAHPNGLLALNESTESVEMNSEPGLNRSGLNISSLHQERIRRSRSYDLVHGNHWLPYTGRSQEELEQLDAEWEEWQLAYVNRRLILRQTPESMAYIEWKLQNFVLGMVDYEYESEDSDAETVSYGGSDSGRSDRTILAANGNSEPETETVSGESDVEDGSDLGSETGTVIRATGHTDLDYNSDSNDSNSSGSSLDTVIVNRRT